MTAMNSNSFESSRRLRVFPLALAVAFIWACASASALSAGTRQQTFDAPEGAVDALVAAARVGGTAGLLKLLGPEGRKLVSSGDPVADKEGRDRFVAAYDTLNKIIRQGQDKAILVIGKDEWTLPIPIVKQGKVWRFDTKAGEQQILERRVGRNELNAIEVCRAYVVAQREYASQDRNDNGILEYAQKFVSSSGRHDGLYWLANPGENESPMGPLVAAARAEGYSVPSKQGKRVPFHGYYYKILKRQGKDAPGGAYNYVANGHMIGGFALVAFPAQYRVSGIMTFIVNQDGIVYQKDLGPDTLASASRMTAFNLDATWKNAP